MTYKSKRLTKALRVNKSFLVYADLIEKLLKSGELDDLIKRIPNSNTKVICSRLYGREFLNGYELFLLNLDYFIDYTNKQTMIPYSFSQLFISCCLQSINATDLITDDYIHKDINTLYHFVEQSDKIIAETFSDKILNIYPKIADKLKEFNVDNKTFEFKDKSQIRLVIELFKGIIITNNEHLVDILPKLLMNFEQLQKKSFDFDSNMYIYEDAWNEALTNLSNKFCAMKELYKFTELIKIKGCDN